MYKRNKQVRQMQTIKKEIDKKYSKFQKQLRNNKIDLFAKEIDCDFTDSSSITSLYSKDILPSCKKVTHNRKHY